MSKSSNTYDLIVLTAKRTIYHKLADGQLEELAYHLSTYGGQLWTCKSRCASATEWRQYDPLTSVKRLCTYLPVRYCCPYVTE